YVVVHAIHDGGVDILAAGRRDNHLLGAALDVGTGLFLAGEQARAFEHDVDLQFTPGQFSRVAVREHTDLVAVHDHVIPIDRYRAGELAMRRVKTRKVGIGLGIAKVVDRHDFDIVFLAVFIMGTQDIAANAAVPVDRYANGHYITPVL